MSQAELAKLAKITREYVNKLEAGRYDPTVGVMQSLARALGVPVTQLLGRANAVCSNSHCQRQALELDDEDMCPRCSRLAARFRVDIKRGRLLTPDFTGELSQGKNVPAIPRPNREEKCSACGEEFKALDDQAQEISAKRNPLYLHHLCREILMRI